MNQQLAIDSTGAEIVSRAAEIATRLTARGAAAEAAGRLPQETIDEIVAADIMRLAVPKRCHGLEVPFPVIPQVSRMLGRGCLATAWTIGILVQHNFQLGFWPRAAQDEFWAQGPSIFAPGYIVPSGTARKVEGGWRLDGHWRMGSGYPHGNWILLGSPEVVDGEKGPIRRFALPITACTAQNNWAVSGLAATGTWDCILDGVFVPEHRSFPAAGLLDGSAPGTQVNTGALWRIPLLPFYYPNMSAMMLGAAEGVASLVKEKLKGRVLSYGGARAAELATVQSHLGAAQTKLNAAAALLEVESNRVWARALAGQPFSMEDRAAVRANCTWIVKMAREVASDLIEFSGTASFMLQSPLQRFHREINVLASHAFYDWHRMTGVYGQVLLGQPTPPDELV